VIGGAAFQLADGKTNVMMAKSSGTSCDGVILQFFITLIVVVACLFAAGSALASAQRVPGLLHPDHRAALTDYSPGAAIADTLDADALENRHPLDRAQYAWIKTMLEGQILTWGGDRVDMANAMEARPPFLDHHLAAYAAMLPPSMRIHGRIEKFALREAMKGLLPETLYKREKFAFMAPPAHTDPKKWAAMQILARRHLSPAAIEAAGLLDAEGVAALFSLHESPDTSVATQTQLDAVINHLLGVQILHQQFIVGDIPSMARRKAQTLGWQAGQTSVIPESVKC